MNAGRRRVAEAALPILIFVGLTLALTYPLILNLGDHLRDDGDSYEYAWVIGFGAYQLTHHPLQLYNGNIFYPFPLSLAYSDSSVPNIVLGTPVVLLTDNPVLALNLMILLTYVLGGYGMYLLVRQRTGSPAAGLVAGILYAFTPYRYDHLAQLPNVSMEWAPFALWSFDRYLARGRWRWAGAFALFSVLQVLVSFYFAFILGIGIALYVVEGLFRAGRTALRPRCLVPLLACCGLGAVVAIPFILPYFELERAFGLSRTLDEATYFSAWPANFLAPTPTMLVVLADPLFRLLSPLRWFRPVGASERHLYPGMLIVLLAIPGVLNRRWGRAVAPLAMVVVGILLSFGPVFHSSYQVTRQLPFEMPYAFLFDYLPGFAALRVPSRFAALTILGLAILAGDGLAQLEVRLRRWRPSSSGWARPAIILPGLCALIGVIEGLNTFAITPVRVGDAVPPVYRWLAAAPAPGAVVELPIDDNAFHESPRSYYSTYHHRPLVDGFRAFLPPAYKPLASLIATFPSDRAITTLERLAVRYVVVHRAELPDRGRSVSDSAAARTDSLKLVARFGSDDVYQVIGAPEPEGVHLSYAAPGCLPKPGASGHLEADLQTIGTEPLILLSPGASEIVFDLDWQGQNGKIQRQVERVPVPSSVLRSPAKLDVPFRVPADLSIHALSVSIANQPGLYVNVASQPVIVAGSSAASSASAAPRLADAALLSPRIDAKDGVKYVLEWQVSARPTHPLVAFVNAYDGRNAYWSFPSGNEPRFPGAKTCDSSFAVESDRLPLRPDSPPGHYWLEAGLIDTVTKERVSFTGPNGETVTRVVVGSFWIYPAGVFPPGVLPGTSAATHDFGGAVLLEQSSVAGSATPGGALDVSLRWQSKKPVSVDYTEFVHLVDSSGHLIAQHDGQPTGGAYPTSAWRPGENVIDQSHLVLPASLPPGPYRIEVGLYDLKTGQRLPVVGPSGQVQGDHVDLAVSVTR